MRRSEAIDLNLTVDEAIQFVVSCGVVVPPQQRLDRLIDTVAQSNATPPKLPTGDKTSGQTPQTQL